MKTCLCTCALVLVLSCVAVAAPALPEVAAPADGKLSVVGEYLNLGGDFYLAMDSGDWTKRVELVLARLQAAFEVALPEEAQEAADSAFYLANGFLRDSGVKDLGGMGASSVALSDDLHHNRLFLQYPAGGAQGFLWDALTDENRPLAFLERLPANTALARWGVVRPMPAWQWLNKAIAASGSAVLTESFREGVKELADHGVELERCLASLKGGVGFVATFDEKHPVRFPLDRYSDTKIEVPAFAGALVVEVKDDTLFDTIGKVFADQKEQFERVEKDGVRALLFPEETIEDSGFSYRVTIARFDDLLVLSSSQALVETLTAKKGGLTETAHFKSCQQSMPQEGFAFVYLNPVATRVAYDALMKAIAVEEPEAARAIAAFYAPLRGLSCWSVTLRTPDGVAVLANQNRGAAELLLTHGPAGQLPIFGGALLPSLVGARAKAQQIGDMNNLKQIGLALYMWNDDHDEKYPDDLGAAWEYIGGMGEVYVCPASKTKPPTSADEVRAGRCDYLYFGKGKKMADMGKDVPIHKVPLACTKPGLLKGEQINVLFADGHVEWREKVPEDIRKLIEATGQK